MIVNCPTARHHNSNMLHVSLFSLADVCVIPGKHFKDSVITKMADVCSKMVDGRVNFLVPVLDHSLPSEPDSRPAEAGALCSFPELFNPLINCCPQSKRLRSQYSTSPTEKYEITLTSNGTGMKLILCLFSCVKNHLFYTVL